MLRVVVNLFGGNFVTAGAWAEEIEMALWWFGPADSSYVHIICLSCVFSEHRPTLVTNVAAMRGRGLLGDRHGAGPSKRSSRGRRARQDGRPAPRAWRAPVRRRAAAMGPDGGPLVRSPLLRWSVQGIYFNDPWPRIWMQLKASTRSVLTHEYFWARCILSGLCKGFTQGLNDWWPWILVL